MHTNTWQRAGCSRGCTQQASGAVQPQAAVAVAHADQRTLTWRPTLHRLGCPPRGSRRIPCSTTPPREPPPCEAPAKPSFCVTFPCKTIKCQQMLRKNELEKIEACATHLHLQGQSVVVVKVDLVPASASAASVVLCRSVGPRHTVVVKPRGDGRHVVLQAGG